MEWVVAAASLMVSTGLAILTFVNWIRDRSLYESNQAERRDSIVVDSAEQAIALSDRLLRNAMNDNEALRNRVRELEPLQARVRELETSIASLTALVEEMKRISNDSSR